MFSTFFYSFSVIKGDDGFRFFLLIICLIIFIVALVLTIGFIVEHFNFLKKLPKEIIEFKNLRGRYMYYERQTYDTDKKIKKYLIRKEGNLVLVGIFLGLSLLFLYFILYPIGFIDAYKVSNAIKKNDVLEMLELNKKETKFVHFGISKIESNKIDMPSGINERVRFYKNNYYIGLELEDNKNVLNQMSIYYSDLCSDYFKNRDYIEEIEKKLNKSKFIKRKIVQEINDSIVVSKDTKHPLLFYLSKDKVLSRIIQSNTVVKLCIDHNSYTEERKIYIRKKGLFNAYDTKIKKERYTDTKYLLIVNDSFKINGELMRYYKNSYDDIYAIDSIYNLCQIHLDSILRRVRIN